MLTDRDRERMRALAGFSAEALAVIANASWMNPYDDESRDRHRRCRRTERVTLPALPELDIPEQTFTADTNYCPLGMAAFADGMMTLENRYIIVMRDVPRRHSDTVFPDLTYGDPDGIYITGVISSRDFAAIRCGATAYQDDQMLRAGTMLSPLPWWHDLFIGKPAIDFSRPIPLPRGTFIDEYVAGIDFISAWDNGIITPSMLVDYAMERA